MRLSTLLNCSPVCCEIGNYMSTLKSTDKALICLAMGWPYGMQETDSSKVKL